VLPSYEGQRVMSVELAGQPGLDPKTLMPLLAQKEGEPFSQAKVDQSIAALKRSGKAREIELEVRPQAQGIRLLFILQPAVSFGIYEFPGSIARFPYSRLLQVTDYPPRGAYSPIDIQIAQTSLVNFFQKNGYFEAQVQPQLQNDTAHALVNVVFHITLG